MKKSTVIKTAALSALFAVASFASTAHATDVTRGALMAATCFACHGTDGRASGDMPSIYGIPEEILTRNMIAFRDGTRPATVMGRHATGYSDEEIREIAAYLSTLR